MPHLSTRSSYNSFPSAIRCLHATTAFYRHYCCLCLVYGFTRCALPQVVASRFFPRNDSKRLIRERSILASSNFYKRLWKRPDNLITILYYVRFVIQVFFYREKGERRNLNREAISYYKIIIINFSLLAFVCLHNMKDNENEYLK